MTTPDAPQDILAAAFKVCTALGIPSTPANTMPIVEALRAERVRCADIAGRFAAMGLSLSPSEAEIVDMASRMILAGDE